MDALRQDIERYPDAYQYEHAERFGVTQMGIWHALRRLKVTYKKTLQHPRADPQNALPIATGWIDCFLKNASE